MALKLQEVLEYSYCELIVTHRCALAKSPEPLRNLASAANAALDM
jgi:hypothetical protein